MINVKLIVLAVLTILLSVTCLAQNSMNIDISISKNDIVRETITLSFISDENYDSVEFTTVIKPVSVNYQGDYSIREDGDYYIISFDKGIKPGKNSLQFTLVYDTIVEGDSKDKIFRTRFYPENADSMNISLTLPTYNILSDKEPSVTPKPDFTTTDGQHIRLNWQFHDTSDIVVFYESERTNFFPIITIPFLALVVVLILFLYFKKRTKKHISDVLSNEEKKVVVELRKGITKQKEIAKNLEFSKSKMSKVIRKLEEKNLIEKKPYFKTNIIKLSSKIK